MSKKHVFSDEDYKSGDGMMTSVWGPALWHVLHTISFNYPINPTSKQKKHYFKFYENLQNILPCKYCRDNLSNNLAGLPISLDNFESRETLSKWVYKLHEKVNKMLGKESKLSYDDVRDRYEHFRSRCLQPKKEIINTNIEKGCTEPLYGVKSKCVINIVPKDNRTNSFKIDPKCALKKVSKKNSKKQSKESSKKKKSK